MYLVSWCGSVAYCDWLSLQQGLPRAYNHSTWECNAGNPYTATGYRLPTEAEWEYACRAGTQTPFSTGSCLDAGTEANYHGRYPYIGCPTGPEVGWTVPVGSYPANAFGLYDMHGNVFEWCNDLYVYGDYGGTVTDPVGAGAGSDRVIRGGFWNNHAQYCRSARRNYWWAYSGDVFGFRPVRSFDENATCMLTANVQDMATALPLAGATVVLQQQDAVTTRSLTTNQLGQCTFEGLPMGGTVVLRAIAGTFRSDLKIVVVGPEKTLPVLRVPQSYEVRGTVRDELNQLPISGAKVELMSGATSIAECSTTGVLLGGAQGDYNFRLSPPGPGEYRLRVSYKRRIGQVYDEEQNLYKEFLSEPFAVTSGVTAYNRGNLDLTTNVVVLLHGAQSSAEIWGNEQHGYVKDLHDAGWAPYDGLNLGFSRRKGNLFWGTKTYGFATVENMAETLETKWRELGIRSCNVVAHSAGGIVARYFNDAQEQPRVSKLVTLATPHHGSRIGYWVNKDEFPECYFKTIGQCGPLVDQLMPDSAFLRALNQGTACPNMEITEYCDWSGFCRKGTPNPETTLQPETTYWAAQGTRWGDEGGGYAGVLTSVLGCSVNDGVVAVDAAKLHAAQAHNAAFALSHGQMYGDAGVSTWVLQCLEGSASPFESNQAPDKRSDEDPWNELRRLEVAIYPESSYQDSLVVDACDSLRVGFAWAPRDAGFAVIMPNGTRVDSSYVALHDSVAYDTTVGGETRWYTFASPDPGVWRVELVTTSSDSCIAMSWADATTPVRMECRLASPVSPFAGTSVLVASLTQAGGSAVVGAEVVSRAVWPDSTISVVVLSDDGLTPDSVPNDGNYSGTLEAGQGAGSVSVDVTAAGMSPVVFSRRHQFCFRNGVYADVSIGGSGLIIQSSSFLAGSPVAVQAVISNAGPWPAEFAVALTDLAVDALVTADTLFVAAGGAVEYSAIYTPLSDGLHRMRIEAWPVGEVVDLAPQGNISEAELVIGDLVAGVPNGGSEPEPQDGPIQEGARWAAIRRADPNPFNPVINIAFWVGQSAQIALDVYDLRGRLVCSLLRDDSFQGDGSVQWNGRDRDGARIGSGVYLIRLRANDLVDVRKIVMLE